MVSINNLGSQQVYSNAATSLRGEQAKERKAAFAAAENAEQPKKRLSTKQKVIIGAGTVTAAVLGRGKYLQNKLGGGFLENCNFLKGNFWRSAAEKIKLKPITPSGGNIVPGGQVAPEVQVVPGGQIIPDVQVTHKVQNIPKVTDNKEAMLKKADEALARRAAYPRGRNGQPEMNAVEHLKKIKDLNTVKPEIKPVQKASVQSNLETNPDRLKKAQAQSPQAQATSTLQEISRHNDLETNLDKLKKAKAQSSQVQATSILQAAVDAEKSKRATSPSIILPAPSKSPRAHITYGPKENS